MRKAVKVPLDENAASLVWLWNNCATEMKNNGCPGEEIEFAKHYFFLGAESFMVALVACDRNGMDANKHTDTIAKEIEININRPDDGE